MIQRVLVGGAIVLGNRILLLKRAESKRFLPGHWDIPGGKVDSGEEPDAAVLREVMEETGLDARISRPYNIWSSIVRSEGREEQCIEIDYLLELPNPRSAERIMLSENEHSEFGWFGKDDLPKRMSPELRKTVLKAIGRRK